MVANLISQHVNISTQEVDRLLSLGAANVYKDPNYLALVDQLDNEHLQETVVAAREAYRQGLGPLKQEIEEKYHLGDSMMSAFTLGNWLVGFLYSSDSLSTLLDKHHRVPPEAIADGLPGILNILDTMGADGNMWKEAMCVLALPLLSEH